MKKIGLIGGVGWPSTIDYYRALCQQSQQYYASRGVQPPYPTPEIVIESLNIHYSLNHRGNDTPGSWANWDNYFNSALRRLENSGAEVLAIASVTPHARLSFIKDKINQCIVSIYDAVGLYCRNKGVRKVLILGTLPTMTNRAFEMGLKCHSIESSTPENAKERERVVDVINKLYANDLQGQRELLHSVIQSILQTQENTAFAICLACTELSTAFPEYADKASFSHDGMLYLNASVIHVQSIFSHCVR